MVTFRSCLGKSWAMICPSEYLPGNQPGHVGYAVSMTPPPALNTLTPFRWAAVVWQAWQEAVSYPPGGDVTRKTNYAASVVWAIAPAKKEAVTLSEPAPSPLEVRAQMVNTSQVFERFKWAAKGRVKHSVRWRSARNVRMRRIYMALHHVRTRCKVLFPATATHATLTPFVWRRALPRRTYKRLVERGVLLDRLLDGIQRLAPGKRLIGADEYEAYDHDLYCGFEAIRIALKQKRYRKITGTATWKVPLRKRMVCYLSLVGDRKALRELLMLRPPPRQLVLSRVGVVTRFSSIVAYITSRLRLLLNAYQAHLTRRVKPISRRTRLPRPLYARPRPPSAPTAPPAL